MERSYKILAIICDDIKKILIVKTTSSNIKKSKLVMKDSDKNRNKFWSVMLNHEYRTLLLYSLETDATYINLLVKEAIENMKSIDLYNGYEILNEQYMIKRKENNNSIKCNCGGQFKIYYKDKHMTTKRHIKYKSNIKK